MVRLEKVLWEQMANIKVLQRARTMGTPSKWYNENRHDAFKVASNRMFNQGITGFVFKIFEPLLARLTYRWWRDIASSRGLALEDFLLFQDRQLRRCYIFEMQARQNFHPYQWIFFKRRRARFYKIERAVRGAYAPLWARQEGENRTLAETFENKNVWENFVYKEYMSEQTPTSRWSSLSKWSPLDIMCLYGLWRTEAYDRYFYNESFYDNYSPEQIKEAEQNAYGGVDLKTQDGRRQFEEQVQRFQELYPGAITKEGTSFDFKSFYARYAYLNGGDTTKFDGAVIEKFKNALAENVYNKHDKYGDKSGSKIGSGIPDFVVPLPGKGLF